MAFESYARACGRRVGSEVGAWRLYRDSLGYTIYEVLKSGGVRSPVSAYSARLSAREMLEALYFAESTLLTCKRRPRSSRRSRS